MGDTIPIDWSLTQNQPNFLQGAVAGYQAGHAIGLQRQADQALQGVDLSRPETIMPLMKVDPERGVPLMNASMTFAKMAALRDLYAPQGGSAQGTGPALGGGSPAPAPPALSALGGGASPAAAPALGASQPVGGATPALGAPSAPAPVAPPPGAGAGNGAPQAAPAPMDMSGGMPPINPAALMRLASIDPATAQQISQFSFQQRQNAAAMLEQHLELAGRVMNSVSQAPPEQQDALYQQERAQLASAGINDLPPTWDPKLAQARIAQAQNLKDALTYGLEVRKEAETERHNAATENEGVPVSPGTALVGKSTGATLFDPNAPVPTDPAGISQRIAAVEGTGQNPRSSAVGPGQFIDSTFVKTYRSTFPDKAAGMTDAQVLAQRGTGVENQMLPNLTASNMTALQKANLPPSAGNTYLAHVLGSAGAISVLHADPNSPLSQLVPSKVLDANPQFRGMTAGQISQWAQSKMSTGWDGSTPKAVGGMSADAVDRAALIYNQTKELPPSLGRGGIEQQGILTRAAYLNRNVPVAQQLAQQAGYSADLGALGDMEKKAATVRAAEGAAHANANLVLQLAPAVNSGNIPLFNAWKNAANKHRGDPAIAKLDAAITTFVNEYASVMGRGQPTDALRAQGMEHINSAQAPGQLTGVVQTMQKDMANRRAGYDQERASLQSRIANGEKTVGATRDNPVPINDPSEVGQVASGDFFKAPNGRVYRKH